MATNENKWDKLTNIPNEYKEDSGIAQKAILEIQQRQTKKAKVNFFARSWKKMLAVCTSVALFFGLGIGMYFSERRSGEETPNVPQAPMVVYYDRELLQVNKVADVEVFLESIHRDILYFSENSTTRCASIAETEEPAYLMQDMLYVGGSGFDQVNLKIVLLENAIFDFEELFEELTYSIELNQISILYQPTINIEDNQQTIYAKMGYDGNMYYFSIISNGEPESVVKQYVELLLD